jgi:putative phosphoribosyl transferase
MIEPRVFSDRTEAGALLARVIARQKWEAPVLVLGLPRGGVPVAYEVARALGAPLDVMLVRKIGMPGHRELAIGAIATGNAIVREHYAANFLRDHGIIFEKLVEQERIELARRELLYRAGLPPLDLEGKTVILVDDGLATGSTMLAALRAAKQAGATSTIVAAPVSSHQAAALVASESNAAFILQIPQHLTAIGEWYARFDQLNDEEVCKLLRNARAIGQFTTPPQARQKTTAL